MSSVTTLPVKKIQNLVTLPWRARPTVGATPVQVIHTENKWRLLRYAARPQGPAYQTPILMVPSLINRHYVLDLMPGKSFVEFLLARGHDVFIIDWGTPGPEDRYLSFERVVATYMGRAIRKCAAFSAAGKVHLMGYCLGATFTSIYAALDDSRLASMVALAPPVAFDDPGMLSQWMRIPTLDLDAIIDAKGNMPWQWMQAAFHMLRPTLTLTKMIGVLDKAEDDTFLEGFRAIETWGNDNVSFPGNCFRDYIQKLYQNNDFAEGRLTLMGRPARLEQITCPLLSVTFKHDNIVPQESSLPLVAKASSADKAQWDLPGGHVGAVIGRKAAKELWPGLSQWWAERD